MKKEIQEFADLSLRGLALSELMSDREKLQDPSVWVDQAMILGSTQEEVMELLVGMNNVIGMLVEMISQATGADHKAIIESLRQSIIHNAAIWEEDK